MGRGERPAEAGEELAAERAAAEKRDEELRRLAVERERMKWRLAAEPRGRRHSPSLQTMKRCNTFGKEQYRDRDPFGAVIRCEKNFDALH